MNEEEEMKQAEELAQSIAHNLHHNELARAKAVYRTIDDDKRSLSEDQFDDVETVSALAHGECDSPFLLRECCTLLTSLFDHPD